MTTDARVTDLPIGALDLHGARPGWVHLVGAGPGDPGLLTLRGAALLATADLVAWDRLAAPELLSLVPSAAETIRVGKHPDRRERSWSQPEINQLLVTAASEGKAVVRLKGGDPFVFGRGSEEALACRTAGVPFEVVSGVTSAVAGPAAAGIPVTHRGLATGVAFVTGHEDPTKPASQVDWEALARFHGTLVFLMGVRRAGHIATRLTDAGRAADTPVAVVQWATTPRQRVVHTTLGALPEDLVASGIGSPATIVVGDVVGVGRQLVDLAHDVLGAPDTSTGEPPLAARPAATTSTRPRPAPMPSTPAPPTPDPVSLRVRACDVPAPTPGPRDHARQEVPA